MRETYSTLLQTSKDFAGDDSTSSTTSLTNTEAFLARQINSTIQYLFAQIKNYKTQPVPRTFSTAADQIYYHYPPNLLSLESVTMSVGSINYPLKAISSQATWDNFQQLDITSAGVPQYYFPRQADFGIWPTPDGVKTVTVVGNFLPQRLSVADYDAGTVAVAQNTRTITGTGTAFSNAMVGRWFCEADSEGNTVGNWYRISAFTDVTTLTLESFFEETSLSSANYVIAQSPEIPEEMHEYIPYRAASIYHSTVRRDPKRGQELLNFFYTGDFANPSRSGSVKGGILGIIGEYKNKGRSNSQLVGMHKQRYDHWRDERWATTLSPAS